MATSLLSEYYGEYMTAKGVRTCCFERLELPVFVGGFVL